MPDSKRVLLIGLRSDAADFSKWPQLTKEKLETWFEQVIVDLEELDYAPTWCLTDRGETAEQALNDALADGPYDCALIGAGVRMDADLTPLLETILNVLHEHAPGTRIALNTNPYDTIEAVKRWT